MLKVDVPTGSLLKAAANLSTAFSGWEFDLGTQACLSGVLKLDLVFGGAATLTLRYLGRSGLNDDSYERASVAEGVGDPDVDVFTIADWETVDTTKKRVEIPLDVRHGSRLRIQAKVDSTSGTPTLEASFQPDNQVRG